MQDSQARCVSRWWHGRLGRAVSLAFLEEGATVVATYRNQKEFDSLKAQSQKVLRSKARAGCYRRKPLCGNSSAAFCQTRPAGCASERGRRLRWRRALVGTGEQGV